jgi:trans-2,3-dihydro-3-hydroxyanthranilate isomerase
MPDYRYHTVDVFTKHQLEGNALAVFPNAVGLDDATMAKIAKELNLSETTFVFPSTHPDAAARVRIFTPTMEMEFAGHPTIGTAFVLVNEGIVTPSNDRFAFEENVGLVPVRIERGDTPMFWLTTPPITFGKTYSRAECARTIGMHESDIIEGLTPQFLTAGNPNIYIPLVNKSAVDSAWTERSQVTQLHGSATDPTCIFVFTPTPEGAYSRMFAPELGVVEDPATGSATGPLAAYMMKNNLVSHSGGTRFISEQGTKMGRRSFLHVFIHGDYGADGIEVGGHVAPLAKGVMTLA